jgi:hypothetical protein
LWQFDEQLVPFRALATTAFAGLTALPSAGFYGDSGLGDFLSGPALDLQLPVGVRHGPTET